MNDDSLDDLRQIVGIALISAIGFVLAIDVMLRFPDLGSLIERYNQF